MPHCHFRKIATVSHVRLVFAAWTPLSENYALFLKPIFFWDTLYNLSAILLQYIAHTFSCSIIFFYFITLPLITKHYVNWIIISAITFGMNCWCVSIFNTIIQNSLVLFFGMFYPEIILLYKVTYLIVSPSVPILRPLHVTDREPRLMTSSK